MPAQVVVVLRDAGLAARTVESLSRIGYSAIAMADSMAALRALESAHDIELLITSANFPGPRPNGLALALMARRKRPRLKVIFANGLETRPHVENEGIYIPTPTTPDLIVAAVDTLMKTHH